MKKTRKGIIAVIGAIVLLAGLAFPVLAYGNITSQGKIKEYSQSSGDLNSQDIGSSAVLYVNGSASVVAAKTVDDTIVVTASGFNGTLNKEIDFPLYLNMYWSTGQSNKGYISTLEVNGDGTLTIKDPDGNNLHVHVKGTITIVPDPDDPGPTDPGPTDPGPTDPGPDPCECKLSYAIAKDVYNDEDCTEKATVVEAGDTVWYKVVVTVSIIDNGCESDDCIGLPEKVTIYDACLANGLVEVSVDEDGKATAVYSFEVEEFDEDGKFINVAYIMVGNDKLSDNAIVSEKEVEIPEDPDDPDEPDDPGDPGDPGNRTRTPRSTVVTLIEEFEDEAPPLAQAPVVVPEPEPEPDVEIADFEFEEEIPLSQMPQTGVNDVILIMACGFLAAAVLLTAAKVTINRMKKDEGNA